MSVKSQDLGCRLITIYTVRWIKARFQSTSREMSYCFHCQRFNALHELSSLQTHSKLCFFPQGLSKLRSSGTVNTADDEAKDITAFAASTLSRTNS